MTSFGAGHYEWRGLDGKLDSAIHWDDLPEEMDYLVAFVPDYPPEPHTQEQHDAMAGFGDKLKEVMKRCRR